MKERKLVCGMLKIILMAFISELACAAIVHHINSASAENAESTRKAVGSPRKASLKVSKNRSQLIKELMQKSQKEQRKTLGLPFLGNLNPDCLLSPFQKGSRRPVRVRRHIRVYRRRKRITNHVGVGGSSRQEEFANPLDVLFNGLTGNKVDTDSDNSKNQDKDISFDEPPFEIAKKIFGEGSKSPGEKQKENQEVENPGNDRAFDNAIKRVFEIPLSLNSSNTGQLDLPLIESIKIIPIGQKIIKIPLSGGTENKGGNSLPSVDEIFKGPQKSKERIPFIDDENEEADQQPLGPFATVLKELLKDSKDLVRQKYNEDDDLDENDYHHKVLEPIEIVYRNPKKSGKRPENTPAEKLGNLLKGFEPIVFKIRLPFNSDSGKPEKQGEKDESPSNQNFPFMGKMKLPLQDLLKAFFNFFDPINKLNDAISKVHEQNARGKNKPDLIKNIKAKQQELNQPSKGENTNNKQPSPPSKNPHDEYLKHLNDLLAKMRDLLALRSILAKLKGLLNKTKGPESNPKENELIAKGISLIVNLIKNINKLKKLHNLIKQEIPDNQQRNKEGPIGKNPRRRRYTNKNKENDRNPQTPFFNWQNSNSPFFNWPAQILPNWPNQGPFDPFGPFGNQFDPNQFIGNPPGQQWPASNPKDPFSHDWSGQNPNQPLAFNPNNNNQFPGFPGANNQNWSDQGPSFFSPFQNNQNLPFSPNQRPENSNGPDQNNYAPFQNQNWPNFNNFGPNQFPPIGQNFGDNEPSLPDDSDRDPSNRERGDEYPYDPYFDQENPESPDFGGPGAGPQNWNGPNFNFPNSPWQNPNQRLPGQPSPFGPNINNFGPNGQDLDQRYPNEGDRGKQGPNNFNFNFPNAFVPDNNFPQNSNPNVNFPGQNPQNFRPEDPNKQNNPRNRFPNFQDLNNHNFFFPNFNNENPFNQFNNFPNQGDQNFDEQNPRPNNILPPDQIETPNENEGGQNQNGPADNLSEPLNLLMQIFAPLINNNPDSPANIPEKNAQDDENDNPYLQLLQNLIDSLKNALQNLRNPKKNPNAQENKDQSGKDPEDFSEDLDDPSKLNFPPNKQNNQAKNFPLFPPIIANNPNFKNILNQLKDNGLDFTPFINMPLFPNPNDQNNDPSQPSGPNNDPSQPSGPNKGLILNNQNPNSPVNFNFIDAPDSNQNLINKLQNLIDKLDNLKNAFPKNNRPDQNNLDRPFQQNPNIQNKINFNEGPQNNPWNKFNQQNFPPNFSPQNPPVNIPGQFENPQDVNLNFNFPPQNPEDFPSRFPPNQPPNFQGNQPGFDGGPAQRPFNFNHQPSYFGNNEPQNDQDPFRGPINRFYNTPQQNLNPPFSPDQNNLNFPPQNINIYNQRQPNSPEQEDQPPNINFFGLPGGAEPNFPGKNQRQRPKRFPNPPFGEGPDYYLYPPFDPNNGNQPGQQGNQFDPNKRPPNFPPTNIYVNNGDPSKNRTGENDLPQEDGPEGPNPYPFFVPFNLPPNNNNQFGFPPGSPQDQEETDYNPNDPNGPFNYSGPYSGSPINNHYYITKNYNIRPKGPRINLTGLDKGRQPGPKVNEHHLVINLHSRGKKKVFVHPGKEPEEDPCLKMNCDKETEEQVRQIMGVEKEEKHTERKDKLLV